MNKKLFCFGCAHSSARHKFPGKPSGERPCVFCVRNPKLPKKVEDYIVNCWYDGSKALKLPMDCYHSLDMKLQFELWEGEGE